MAADETVKPKRISATELVCFELSHEQIVKALGLDWDAGWRLYEFWHTSDGSKIRLRLRKEAQ